ncbi:MAG: hypothetical protein AAF226_03435 [Verrucomicrobiota bacterium]
MKFFFQVSLLAGVCLGGVAWGAEVSVSKPSHAPSGATRVTADNSKGQVFRVSQKSQLDSFAVVAVSIDKVGDLSFQILAANSAGVPNGDPLVSDSVSLPNSLRAGDQLSIALSDSLELAAGDYALVLSSDSSDLRLALSSSELLPNGKMLRKNRETNQEWGFNSRSDLDLPSYDFLVSDKL